jgi:hypothetical protein
VRTFSALVGRSVRRHRALIVSLTALLSAFQFLLVVVARDLQREGLFSQMAPLVPAFIQEAFGGAEVSTFGGTIAFGFFHPVVMLSLCVGAIYVASEPAGEVEDGLVDLLAARPLPRHLFITRSALVSGGSMAAVVLTMLVANRLAIGWLVPSGMPAPRTTPLIRIAANLLAVVWCFGAAGLAAAAQARRRAAAAGGVAIAAVFLYLLQFAAASWAPARPYARLSPFHYYQAMRTLLGLHDPQRDMVVLFAAVFALSGCAYLLYARRDL